MGYYEVAHDIVNLMVKLRKNGIESFFCSNNYKDKIDFLEKEFFLSKYFDLMIFSYNVGVQKPDKRIFEEVVWQSGYKPEEILYTDNKEEKLEGARNIGMQVHVYTGFDSFKKYLRSFGLDV